MNYIIFGGSFDPIHNGHLRIANAAAKKYNATVIFVPSKNPRWKNPNTTIKDRIEMVKLSLEDIDFTYEICLFEANSNKPINYTIDTIKYLKTKYPNDIFYLLIGSDQVDKFDNWKSANKIASLAHILYVARPDFELNKNNIQKFKMVDLDFSLSGNVSSKAIREMKSIDTPKKVLSYIELNNLYYLKTIIKFIDGKRLNHSKEVANLALKIAENNNLTDLHKFYFAGLLHDIGKTYKDDSLNMKKFMDLNFPLYTKLPIFSYHQFFSAYIAKTSLNIDDNDILDAIEFHCTGKKNMSCLGMIIYAADKIEPTREFDSTNLINSCLKNWKQGFLDTLKDNKIYLLEHHKDISNFLTDECFKMYLE